VNLLDLLLVVIVGASVVAGFMSGFARVGIGLLCAIFGMIFAFWFYGIPAVWIHKLINSMPLSNIFGFLFVFFAFVVAGALIGRIIAKLFKWTGLGWLDRLMGAAFGFLRGSLVAVALVAILLAFTPKPLPNWMIDSTAMPYAIEASHLVSEIAPSGIKDAVVESMNQIKKAWDEQVKRHERNRDRDREHEKDRAER
jgi:membrane protein required for colicin V production